MKISTILFAFAHETLHRPHEHNGAPQIVNNRTCIQWVFCITKCWNIYFRKNIWQKWLIQFMYSVRCI